MQNTLFSDQVRALHGAVLDIVNVMNRPQMDAAMVREAGISLESALFPLLVKVGRVGPIGVVDLADRVGRDYTTISRQIARLDALGLVERRPGAADRRVREAVVTPRGRDMIDAIDAARERLAGRIFSAWADQDVEDLVRLMRRFADALGADAQPGLETAV